MKFKLLTLSLLFQSCSLFEVIDKELWVFGYVDNGDSSTAGSFIKYDGYYKLDDRQKAKTSLMPYLFFYQTGYICSDGLPDRWYSFSNKDLRGKDILLWGKYLSEEKSVGKNIILQYFFDTSQSGSFIPVHRYTIYEGRGDIPNDSTILIYKVKYKIASEESHLKPAGIYEETHIPPLTYRFVKSKTPPPENWLMEVERKKKKK